MTDQEEITFTEAEEVDIAARIDFERSDWLGDWWYPGGNPEVSWKQLIELSLRILSADATKRLYPDAYQPIPETVTVDITVTLPVGRVRGAKRVNAVRGEYFDFTGAMGMDFLRNPARAQSILDNPPKRSSVDRFRMHGKDSSCMVEGTWFHWICFAQNVLASENTRLACPAVHRPEVANDNY